MDSGGVGTLRSCALHLGYAVAAKFFEAILLEERAIGQPNTKLDEVGGDIAKAA